MTAADFHPNPEFMRRAIFEAREHLEDLDGGPFGACIVQGGEILAVGYNTVLRDHDPTGHAEINAIRRAARELGTYDLSGCDLYSTTEPCPMCFAAIHWARIGRLIYGTGLPEVAALGFNEMAIHIQQLKVMGQSPVAIHPHFLWEECRHLLDEWLLIPGRVVY